MTDDRWEGWQFLLGEWQGEGSGKPGEGSAIFSFYLDLQENVLVRRNRVDYPATEPEIFFTEPHYKGFPAVLVRLSAVDVDDLKNLLMNAWSCQAPPELIRGMDQARDR